MMKVGILKITLRISHHDSLKDKRRLVQSLMAKLRNQFPVSAAEVAYQSDRSQSALGIAIVNSDPLFLTSLLDKVLQFIINQQGDYQLIHDEKQILSCF